MPPDLTPLLHRLFAAFFSSPTMNCSKVIPCFLLFLRHVLRICLYSLSGIFAFSFLVIDANQFRRKHIRESTLFQTGYGFSNVPRVLVVIAGFEDVFEPNRKVWA